MQSPSSMKVRIGVVTAGTTNPPELMCAPYLPGRRLLYGVMSNGGGSLQWLSQLSGQPIDRLIALPRSNSDDLLLLPYLNGERSPIWDSNASGVFLGLRTAHGLGDLAHAVMQGVAFSLRQNLELVEQHASLKVQTVVVSGGAARLQTWNRIKADVLSKRIVTQKSPHAGILGIAVLAAVATGVYPTIESAAESMIHTAALLEPREDLRPRANRMFDIYKRSYPALRDIFTDLSAINQGEFDQ
jgi:xylulokinase